MTAPARADRAAELTARIRRTNSVYARAYGPLSLLIIAASFFPYYSPAAQSSTTYGNLWQEVLLTGREVDVFALFVLLFTVGMLGLAAFARTSVPGLIAVLTGAIIIGCTLLQSPGYVSPPALTVFGIIDITLAFLVAAIALAHSIHLFVLDLGFQRRMV
ncbi:hypothetical protein [Brevibacterium spongiae]|uniref:Uncharacterized protein n=1 Tax=Brevibacterium spongiae TaxID=2909672 RepID=A0ABY5SLJ0_9MICO|nr:hypothetical protein [Brevibacterium spongiae]UVI35393.1 hypothetical protein L1F31_14905 [Brevibacterium spongiae]